jgi:5-methyltetrahydrofolate--homocysteine methyltransferase
MNREEFHKRIVKSPLVLGEATIPECGIRGCPEKWAVDHFEKTAPVLSTFKDGGCDVICCPTAGANRYRLDTFGLASQTCDINKQLLRRCRETLGDHILFGTCSTVGMAIEPFGDLGIEDAIACYSQQTKALIDEGANGFLVSNVFDIQEARAAVIAIRELGDYPVLVHMHFGPKQRTAVGTDPLSALVTLQSLGADAVGFGVGDSGTVPPTLLESLKQSATVPLFAHLCADGTSPDNLANVSAELANAGTNAIGIGIDATPEHITSVAGKLRGTAVVPVAKEAVSALSSARSTVCVGRDYPFAVVGERINPTGKKMLQASLREGSMEMVEKYAVEQLQRKASILDVNMGLSGIDEMAMMLRAIRLLSNHSPLPLCVDTTRPEVVEAALRLYPGRALVNSVSGEQERIERTLPIAVKYGAMFIALPLTDEGIPDTVNKRIGVVESIVSAAQPYGITVSDVVVDGLVMTISSNARAASDTLDLIGWCSDSLGSNTIVGLSNVSFGMPQRPWINGAFLGMAMGRGLTMAIANPSSDGIMATVEACNSLRGSDVEMLARSGNFSGGNS